MNFLSQKTENETSSKNEASTSSTDNSHLKVPDLNSNVAPSTVNLSVKTPLVRDLNVAYHSTGETSKNSPFEISFKDSSNKNSINNVCFFKLIFTRLVYFFFIGAGTKSI